MGADDDEVWVRGAAARTSAAKTGKRKPESLKSWFSDEDAGETDAQSLGSHSFGYASQRMMGGGDENRPSLACLTASRSSVSLTTSARTLLPVSPSTDCPLVSCLSYEHRLCFRALRSFSGDKRVCFASATSCEDQPRSQEQTRGELVPHIVCLVGHQTCRCCPVRVFVPVMPCAHIFRPRSQAVRNGTFARTVGDKDHSLLALEVHHMVTDEASDRRSLLGGE